jgi:predicted DNA-binding transcriptional regulator AlpA
MGDAMDGCGDAAKDSGERFLRTEDAARVVGLSPLTLNKLRSVGGGPPFRSLGRRCVVYDRKDLIEWVLAQPKRLSTSN